MYNGWNPWDRKPKESKDPFTAGWFPNDGALWRVDWFGGLSHNFRTPPYNHLLEIWISRLRTSAADTPVGSEEAANIEAGSRRAIYIDINRFPFLHIGSIWKNGEYGDYTDQPEYETYKTSDLRFSNDTLKFISPDSFETVGGRSSRIIPEGMHPFGRKPADSRLVAVTVNDDPYGLLIPAMEVVRFYYCPSPRMAELIFSGPYDRIASAIYDESRSGLMADGRYVVCVEPNFAFSAFRIIVLLASSRYARLRAREIYDRILFNQQILDEPVVEALPPFKGSAELWMHGIWFESHGKRRFLAYWIDASNLPWPGGKVITVSRSPRPTHPITMRSPSDFEPACEPYFINKIERDFLDHNKGPLSLVAPALRPELD